MQTLKAMIKSLFLKEKVGYKCLILQGIVNRKIHSLFPKRQADGGVGEVLESTKHFLEFHRKTARKNVYIILLYIILYICPVVSSNRFVIKGLEIHFKI